MGSRGAFFDGGLGLARIDAVLLKEGFGGGGAEFGAEAEQDDLKAGREGDGDQ